MVGDGVLAGVQLFADLTVRPTLAERTEYLALTVGQVRRSVGLAAGR